MYSIIKFWMYILYIQILIILYIYVSLFSLINCTDRFYRLFSMSLYNAKKMKHSMHVDMSILHL